jgi:lauroyl/myristoyl acyltransferase
MTKSDRAQRQPPRDALWQRVAVAAFAGLIHVVERLPAWLAYGIADGLAVVWFLWWSVRDRKGRRSSGYWRNCRIAFRQGAPLGPTRPKRHLWRWSRHIAWLLIDFCRMRRITKDNLSAHVEMKEYPRLAELFAKQQGLIFATGHVGVWDVSGYAAGLVGLPLTSVFRPSPLPALNRLIERLRTGSGQTVVARKNVMWTLK